MKKATIVLAVLLAGCSVRSKSDENVAPLDAQRPELFEFFDEALRLFNSVPRDGDITGNKQERARQAYGRSDEPRDFHRDYTDKTASDFSVRFDAPGTGDSALIGFTPGPWIDSWPVADRDVLHLDLKATADCGRITLALLDRQKKRAQLELADFKADATWHSMQVPLNRFQTEAGFDFADGIIGCEVRGNMPKGAKLWFDNIYFEQPGNRILGVTEKPLAQRLAEADRTRDARATPGPLPKRASTFQKLARQIEQGRDLQQANAALVEYLNGEEKGREFRTGFFFSGQYAHLILKYGAKGRIAPGRLTAKAERALLTKTWDMARVSDDIANARKSTWWLIGSENHDIHHKVNCLLTAQVLANDPDYADKVYVDGGWGTGYHEDGGTLWRGEGDWADGKPYMPRDHYKAWVKFFREFLRQRAKKGLFVEVRSEHYINVQIKNVSHLYHYCDDPEVRELAGMLLDLVYADYVQDSMSGVPGGARTRSSIRTKIMETLIPLLGGPGGHRGETYELPPIVWKLALKRETLGSFAYLSRRPGESEDIWPRPKGTGRLMMCDTESRFLRYSWVTPDYILGTQMDHPAAVHSHLSLVSRRTGVTFSSSSARPWGNRTGVYPYIVSKPEYSAAIKKKIGQRYFDYMYSSVQDRAVLIFQQPKQGRVRYVSPKWYPTHHTDLIGAEAGVYIEDADQIEERDGWVFVRKANAYVAIRPIMIDPDGQRDGRWLPLLEQSYEWSDDRKIIKLKDNYSPVIIECGRKAEHGDFGKFQDAILANPLKARQLIAGNYELIYRGAGAEARELVFNHDGAAIPTVDGQPINYRHPYVFDSPYLKSRYNAGVATIRRANESLTLDFNKVERRKN